MGTCHIVLVGGILWGRRPLVAVYQDMTGPKRWWQFTKTCRSFRETMFCSLPRHAGLVNSRPFDLLISNIAVY